MKHLLILTAVLTFVATVSAQTASREFADMDADAQMACFVIWREGDFYYLTYSAGVVRTTTLRLMRSKDATHWEPVGTYLDDGYFTDPGTDCSCNNVLPLGKDKHLILFFAHNQGPK